MVYTIYWGVIMNSNDSKNRSIDFLILGQNVREIRNSLNMTQDQFAEKLNINPHSLSRIENGNVGISLDNAINICNVANCSPVKLFKGLAPIPDILDQYELLNDRDKNTVKNLIQHLSKNE